MDIDIDLQPFNPLEYFDNGVQASLVKNQELVKHNAGVYFQNIPKDPLTGLAAIPYREAEKLGYFKIDFLHLNLLDHFTSKEQIRKLMKISPDWSLLKQKHVVERLFHIHNHFDLIQQVNPQCVEDLADCVALIRPGKRKLLSVYLKDKRTAQRFLYQKQENETYSFKKGHALCYAFNIILNLHLIRGGVL